MWVNRESLLHVSVVIYNHLQKISLYTKRHIQHGYVALSVVSDKIHKSTILTKWYLMFV